MREADGLFAVVNGCPPVPILRPEVSKKGKRMKINYFEDTDTALIEFTSERSGGAFSRTSYLHTCG